MMDISRLSPAAQKQVLDKLTGQKKSKYGNEKAFVNGIKFDSKKEARRYMELLAMQREGRIRDLRLQADFTLVEAYTTVSGERVQAMRYRADFTYERATAPDATGAVHWLREVEDCKGMKTEGYKLKKKLMLDKYGISIKET